MNNIAVKVDLLKGSAGTGIDKTIPQNGVIYYDGSGVPDGYEVTDDPTSGGGGGSSPTYEVIMGDLDRVYGTTPSNYIGTFNTWVDIDSGKSFSDYDEILLVSKLQSNPTYGTKTAYTIDIDRVDVNLLEHYDVISRQKYVGNTIYVKYGLDYTTNKFYLENFNYLCPIALVGVNF